MYCDEFHAHSYNCVGFDHPSSGIVDRLINEIETQREILEEISKLISE